MGFRSFGLATRHALNANSASLGMPEDRRVPWASNLRLVSPPDGQNVAYGKSTHAPKWCTFHQSAGIMRRRTNHFCTFCQYSISDPTDALLTAGVSRDSTCEHYCAISEHTGNMICARVLQKGRELDTSNLRTYIIRRAAKFVHGVVCVPGDAALHRTS